MSFGMSNSPASFQWFMNRILEELYQHFEKRVPDIQQHFKNYMDYCGLGTLLKEKALHIEIIHFFFDLLKKHDLHFKLSKSVFLQPQMDFLGVQISKEEATINPAKVLGLREYPTELKDLRQVRGFLEVAGYHQIFCIVFKGPVQSGLLTILGMDRDLDRSRLFLKWSRPGPDRFGPVQISPNWSIDRSRPFHSVD